MQSRFKLGAAASASALVLSLLVAACGGGGDDSTPDSAAPPSASSSSAAASSAAASSAAASSDAASSDATSSAAALVSWLPTYTTLSSVVASDPATNASVNFNASTLATIGGYEFSSPTAGHLRLYKDSAGTSYAVNFNGDSVASLGAAGTTITIPSSFRYVAFPSVAAGSQVAVSYSYANSASCDATCTVPRVALVDAAGNVLASDLVYSASTVTQMTATATSTGKVYVVFSRNFTGTGTAGGGLRIWSLEK
ncbi:MAG TPA: hypothetical protein VLC92_05775 [Rhodocyclaceae bacterium]|nr:hypothetical protein [Rhodocyclaceae bacterium]